MSKRKRNLIIIISVLTLIIVLSLVFRQEKQPDYTTELATIGTLKQTVDATGKVESDQDIDLSFSASGRLASLLVEKGSEVVAGQALAYLDTAKISSQITEAEARLDQSKADYDRLISGSSAQEIKIYEDTVERRQEDLSAAQKSLTSLISTKETDLYNLEQNLIITIQNESSDAKNALNEIKKILDDNDASKTLSAKDSTALIKTNSSYNQARDLVDNLEIELLSLNSGSSDNDIFRVANITSQALNATFDTTSYMLDALEASVPSSQFTQTEIDAYETVIEAQQSYVNTAKTNTQSAKSTLENKITYYADREITAENSIAQAKKMLQIAKSELDLKKIPPRDFEIDLAKAKIKQAESSLALTVSGLNDYKITSPVDGTITDTYYYKGEQVTANQPVVKMIGANNFRIEVDIPESDIAKLQIGQNVEITFDAFSEEEIFDGKLVFIDPAETIIQDVVYYKAKIQLTSSSEQIKPGMTANVVICTNRQNNVLYVPARAVEKKDNRKYVKVLSVDNMVTEKEVTTGMKGDLGIEILTGISEGEPVITFIKEN